MIRVSKNRYIKSLAVRADRIKHYLLSTSTPIPVAYSLQFPGVDEFVDLSGSVAYLDFNAPATISAWVKLSGSHKTTGGSVFTLSNFTGTANFTVGFGSASGAWTNEVLSVRYLNDAGSVNNGVAFVDATDSYNGNWYHIVATCSGSAWKLYMNAVDKTLTNFTSNTGKFGDGITASKASIGIIMRNSGNLIPFPGFIDQFSIWNKALSGAEVAELYAMKPDSIPDYSTLSFWANRVIWNPIGETGDTWGASGGIKDYSGNNYHGTMQNFDPVGSFSTDVAN